MNSNPHPQTESRPILAYATAIIGTFLIVAALVWAMRRHTEPAQLDQNRVAERTRAMAELRQAEAQSLNHPGWIDKNKGLVRLPIRTAMDATLRAWQNPEAAKADLVARVEKATAQPPAAPPEPSEFE